MLLRILTLVLLLLNVTACGEEGGFVGVPDGARAFVTSDPPGGRILVDAKETGRFTPDTIRGLTGRHDITVRLDTMDVSYRYNAQVVLTNPDSIANVRGPLVLRCASMPCYRDLFSHYSANRLRFASNPVGTLFLEDSSGEGLLWPSTSRNSYASGGMVMFAGLMENRDTVALGMYNTEYLAGRPFPNVVQEGSRILLRQETWLIPPSNLLQQATVRGMRITQQVVATADVEDVMVLRLVFHNITDLPIYHLVDPFVPAEGIPFLKAFIGYALDADVGVSTDDFLSYDLAHDLVFAYDSDFEENGFDASFRRRPGLVGLRVLEAPPGTIVFLSGWSRQGLGTGDWFAGLNTERIGWRVLSGDRPFAPDHPDPRIGYMPSAPVDVRIAVSAGPLDIAPGDSAAITVAVVMAAPVEGTFTSGVIQEPGNPTDGTRALLLIAADLLERARAATALAPLPEF